MTDTIARVKIVLRIVRLPFLAIVFQSMFRKVQGGVVSPKTFVLNGAIPAT
jgi:hypothetical protein